MTIQLPDLTDPPAWAVATAITLAWYVGFALFMRWMPLGRRYRDACSDDTTMGPTKGIGLVVSPVIAVLWLAYAPFALIGSLTGKQGSK